MRDTILRETLEAIRGKMLEKAGKNPLQLVAITDKNGYTTHRWKNMMSDQEIPEEMWTDEMKEKAKAAAAKLLAAGAKAKKKEIAATEKTNKEMSDDDFLSMYHSNDPKTQADFKLAAYHKIKDIVNAMKKRYWQFTNENKGVLDSVANDMYADLVSKRERQKRVNKGKMLSDLDVFEMARNKAKAKGTKKPNLEQYLVMSAANKFKNAIKATNAFEQKHIREKTAGSDDEGTNYSADQIYGAAAEGADDKLLSAEDLGKLRERIGLAIRLIDALYAAIIIEKLLRGKSDDYICNKYSLSAKQLDHVYTDAKAAFRKALHVKKSSDSKGGKGAKYEMPDHLKAADELLFNLEKAQFLKTLEK